MKHFLSAALCASLSLASFAQTDIESDTWVATDGLGRTMPTSEEVGSRKTDKERTVGIFYITWHTRNNHNGKAYTADVTKVLAEDDSARFDMHRPAWKDQFLHWGEPEYGYFLSQDEYVCRHDMSMLSDADVDVLILDVTNATMYWDEWNVLFRTMHRMKAEGNQVPKMCFWAYNGNAFDVVQQLYDTYYKENKFRDLWFYWNGKPLLLYNSEPQSQDFNGAHPDYKNGHYDPDAVTNPDNPHYGDPEYCLEFRKDYSEEVKNFFTLRNMWWGYKEVNGKPYVGTDDNWCFGYELNDPDVRKLKPEQLVAHHNGRPEEMAVTPAQHPITDTGKCWRRETGEPELGKGDMPVKAFVPWLGKEVKNPTTYGIYFQDRWEEALQVDPDFLYLNDWNEWSAGRWPFNREFQGRKLDLNFVDQYNAEYNRTIAPVKDKTFGDNFYMQMVQNIRRYKGVRPIPEGKGLREWKVDGNFDKWKDLSPTYYDTKGDIFHRDEDGYGDLHYTNNSGRNDIVLSRIAVGEQDLLFYVETASALTPWSDPNWMLLFIDADQNPETGWCGFDFVVNKQVKSSTKTTLQKWTGKRWSHVADLDYALSEGRMEISIPRKLLRLQSKEALNFDFKWCDNPVSLEDALSLCTDGDSAPNRRFCYRCKWKK